MLSPEKQRAKTATPASASPGERASPEKWRKVQIRADELALNEGKPHETKNKHFRRAKRELLGLQTLPDPDKPLETMPLAK
jgi:hypothetical protein